MRLVDLHPRFINSGGDGIFDKNMNPAPLRVGVGVMFDCPCGKCGFPLFIPFDIALDGKSYPYKEKGWHRVGDTFETLTLTPSILRIKDKNGYGCNWHGFITNGEIITV